MAVRKTRLSDRDISICKRLKEAREWLSRTQDDVAQQLNLQRTTLQNYEQCRTPLRFEIALRFCRQFIISEEWLATGKYTALWAVAPNHLKTGSSSKAENESLEKRIFRRQCVDLLSEPASLHIRPGTLFSEAYDKALAPHYWRLVDEFFFRPRIVVTDSDIPELAINYLTAINERFILLLNNEAMRRHQNPKSAWRVYWRRVYECSELVFRKMMRQRSSGAYLESLQWLREAASDPDYSIPFPEDGDAKQAQVERAAFASSVN